MGSAMSRLLWIARTIYPSVIAAWWDAWDALWQQVSDLFDPDYQRDVRSQDRNDAIMDLDVGSGGWAAGTGSDAD